MKNLNHISHFKELLCLMELNCKLHLHKINLLVFYLKNIYNIYNSGNNLKINLSIVLFIPLITNAQLAKTELREIDSLKKIILTSNSDTIKIKSLQAWDNIIYRYDDNLDLILNKKIDSIASKNLKNKISKKERTFYLNAKGSAVNVFGIVSYYERDYPNAIKYYSAYLSIMQSLGKKREIANALNNIGNVYKDQGIYNKAIEYYTKCLKSNEEIRNDDGIAMSHNNIGLIYYTLNEHQTSLNHFKQSLAFYTKIKDEKGIALSHNNIGLILQDLRQLDSALMEYQKSLELRIKIEDKKGIGTSLNNIGVVFKLMGDNDRAIDYMRKSLEIRKQINDKHAIANSLQGIGTVEYKQKKYNQAITTLTQAFNLSKEINSIDQACETANFLYKSYNAIGKKKEALRFFELYIQFRDSITSEENQKEVIRQEYKYTYEKQAAADSVKNLEEKKVKDAFIAQQKAELKAKRNQQFMLFGGLALVVVFAGFIFNRFRVTQKQKGVIEHQKAEVEEKNKEITDSINYAKRIQNAILPPAKLINELLPQSFVLYKPKDIVAGDFYWLEKKGETILFAACDCTGHGVPGAMVSVICNNGLNRSVREYNLTDPGKILDKTREIVLQEFEKSEEEVKDGMDVSLLVFNGNSLKWSGANNPLWLIRNGELIEYKANKQPIGKYADPKPFTTHEIEIQKGDALYIFTDGLQDQFGGEKGKKFKASKLKELLLSIQNKTMSEQLQIIEEAFEQWKGNLEQNDDVCLIGILN